MNDGEIRTLVRSGRWAGNAWSAACWLASNGQLADAERCLELEAPRGVAGVREPKRILRAAAERARRASV